MAALHFHSYRQACRAGRFSEQFAQENRFRSFVMQIVPIAGNGPHVNIPIWKKIKKKVLLGSMMLLGGFLANAIILAGAMANEWNVNGELSAMRNIGRYGLTPAMVTFSITAAIGFLLALWGVLEKKQ